MVVATMYSAPVQAGELSAYSTGIAYSDRQCREGYRTVNFQELMDGGCFKKHNPYVKCTKKLKAWKDIQTITDRRCLSVFSDVAMNDTVGAIEYNQNDTVTSLRKRLAYHVIRNELFAETLNKLDRLELEKVTRLR